MCIPTIDPVLSPQIYEMVLYDFLKTDYSVSFVCVFLYDTCSNILMLIILTMQKCHIVYIFYKIEYNRSEKL